MDTKGSDEAIVHAAVDTLLLVVKKSAEDLQNFHDAMVKLRSDDKAPFPRILISTADSIVEHLTRVEEQLKKVTVAAGL